MAQYIKFVQEPTGFKMYIRLEKGAEPFPESRRDSYWFCDLDDGDCIYCSGEEDVLDAYLPVSKCFPNFKAIVENESDVDANGVRRLKVGQILITFVGGGIGVERLLGIDVRDDFVNVLGKSREAHFQYEYCADEISVSHATSKCPEILAWSPPPAAPAVTPVAENANAFAREEITLLHEEIAILRKEIAVLRSEMDARQKRTDAIMAAAIRNLDEKISAK